MRTSHKVDPTLQRYFDAHQEDLRREAAKENAEKSAPKYATPFFRPPAPPANPARSRRKQAMGYYDNKRKKMISAEDRRLPSATPDKPSKLSRLERRQARNEARRRA